MRLGLATWLAVVGDPIGRMAARTNSQGGRMAPAKKAAENRDPSTTKLYDRRGYNPEKAASFLRPIDFRSLLGRNDPTVWEITRSIVKI